MRLSVLFIIAFSLFCSCLKEDNTVDVMLYIKTPFRKGEIIIKQNGIDWVRNHIQHDSTSGVSANGVEDGVTWNVEITKDSAYYQSEPALIRLSYNRDTTILLVYFDSNTTSVSKEFYITKKP